MKYSIPAVVVGGLFLPLRHSHPFRHLDNRLTEVARAITHRNRNARNQPTRLAMFLNQKVTILRLLAAIVMFASVYCCASALLRTARDSPSLTRDFCAWNLEFDRSGTNLLMSGAPTNASQEWETMILDIVNGESRAHARAGYGPVSAWLPESVDFVAHVPKSKNLVIANEDHRTQTFELPVTGTVIGAFSVDRTGNIFAPELTVGEFSQSSGRIIAFVKNELDEYIGPTTIHDCAEGNPFSVSVSREAQHPRIAISYTAGCGIEIGRVLRTPESININRDDTIATDGPAWLVMSPDGEGLVALDGNDFRMYDLTQSPPLKKWAVEVEGCSPLDFPEVRMCEQPLAVSQSGEYVAFSSGGTTAVVTLRHKQKLASFNVASRSVALSLDASILAVSLRDAESVECYSLDIPTLARE